MNVIFWSILSGSRVFLLNILYNGGAKGGLRVRMKTGLLGGPPRDPLGVWLGGGLVRVLEASGWLGWCSRGGAFWWGL